MSKLILGPSSVGKSTFIELVENVEGQKKIYHALNAAENNFIDPNTCIHYNMLHRYSVSHIGKKSVLDASDIYKEKGLMKIIDSGCISEVVVLVASYEDLYSRMGKRQLVEKGYDAKYPPIKWINILKQCDLLRHYEAFFDFFEEKAIPYKVILSRDNNGKPDFIETDRLFIAQHLANKPISKISKSSVESVANSPLCEYQSVLLPYGIRTKTNQKQLKARNSFLNTFPENIQGKSILDIGCALGGLLLTAERLGAKGNVGVEMNPKRFAGAQIIKDLLQSTNTILFGNFMDISFNKSFDYIFALNVIHHVPDYLGFLRKASELASRGVILEYPTIQDKRFATLFNCSPETLKTIDDIPLIGVSSHKKVDQTYVFSPSGMDGIMMDKIGGFTSCSRNVSNIPNRVISMYYK